MSAWHGSRIAASHVALVAVESITRHTFTILLREWKMTIFIKAPWWSVWWYRWRALRAARTAVRRLNVPVEVRTQWERQQ